MSPANSLAAAAEERAQKKAIAAAKLEAAKADVFAEAVRLCQPCDDDGGAALSRFAGAQPGWALTSCRRRRVLCSGT